MTARRSRSVRNINDFIRQIRDDKRLDLLNRPDLGPAIDFELEDVDRDRKFIRFISGGISQEPVKFKTIRNYISSTK